MRILITGITGRIGANVAAALVRDGHRVRGLVWPRDPRVAKLLGLDLKLQHGSLTDPDDVLKAVDGMDAVYHMGAAFQGGGPFVEEGVLRDQRQRHVSDVGSSPKSDGSATTGIRQH